MDYILNRRSVRKYDLSKKISDEELKDLCRYGEAAPSARRQSSREYIIINNQEIINELSKVSKGSMILSECNTVIAVVGKDPSTLVTPHMQAQDLSAAVENILLAATKKGYGSCWIGIYPLEERMKPANDILKVNDNRFVFALIALGYPLNSECFYDANKLKDDMIHFNEA
ncbi:MAG: nitroreductase family protein [Acholeplasmatales bacterium]|nr:nitroreductase family protein [Acholeplasmatales bacterium]